MLSKWLRTWLFGKEYMELHVELEKTNELLKTLANQADTLQQGVAEAIRQGQELERDKVDADFLGLIWVFLGVVVLFANSSAKNTLEWLDGVGSRIVQGTEPVLTITDASWMFLYAASMYILLSNVLFGIKLARHYANSKNDPGYIRFVNAMSNFIWILIIWALFYVLGGIAKSFFGF